MYLDNVIVVSLLTVGAMIAFMGGFVYFVYHDAHKNDGHKQGK